MHFSSCQNCRQELLVKSLHNSSFKYGSVMSFFKIICTFQFEKFGQELLFKLLVINIQELQMSPIIQFCSNNWWCKPQVAMIILNKFFFVMFWLKCLWDLWKIGGSVSFRKECCQAEEGWEKMNLIAIAQIFAQIR